MVTNYPEAIKHYPGGMQIFIKTICNRVWSGKNALIVVVGQAGSGKSYATISLMIGIYLYKTGRMPTPEDIIGTHCLFKAQVLLEHLNSRDLKVAEAWNWDEAGVDMSHKAHASIQNRAINFLLQTFRNQRQIVFFTVPTIRFIDASARKLIHYQLEAKSVDKSRSMCKVKPLLCQYNVRKDEVYYHNLKYPAGGGMFQEIDNMGVPLAPKEFIDMYEGKKNIYTSDLNLDIQNMLVQHDKNNIKPLTERQEEILKLLEEGMTVGTEIAVKLGVAQPVISKNIQYMRRKGVNVDKWLKRKA